MKKFLLFSAAALIAAGASAAEVVLAESDFASSSAYYFWAQGTEPTIENGGLTITNDAATENFWNLQYIVADNMAVTAGTEYTVSIKLKGFSGPLHYVFGAWGTDVFTGAAQVEAKDDWQTITFGGTASADVAEGVHLLLQSGEFVGSYTIANVKITYDNGEGGNDDPVDVEKEVIATMYPGNAQFIAWGCDDLLTQNFEIDGRVAAKFAQTAEGKDPWGVQFAYDYDYVPGTKYFFSFEVKGEPNGTVGSGFQCTDGYVGCGDCTSFAITSDWTKVIISGEAKEVDGKLPNRWVASIGSYIGTFYISNVELYTEKATAVETIAPAKAVTNGVYNLQGVKVLNNADDLNALPKGIYIVNGKKVVR